MDLEVVDGKTRSTRINKEEYQLAFGGWIQDFPDPGTGSTATRTPTAATTTGTSAVLSSIGC
jgi:ABC-type oligopeptide transport system substrate-binding subunit